jgi:hypothetical protein
LGIYDDASDDKSEAESVVVTKMGDKRFFVGLVGRADAVMVYVSNPAAPKLHRLLNGVMRLRAYFFIPASKSHQRSLVVVGVRAMVSLKYSNGLN